MVMAMGSGTRRAMLRSMALAGVSVPLVSLVACKNGPSADEAPANPDGALTGAEFAAVAAIMARLLPADAHSGGAVEAGAHRYLDKALAGYLKDKLPVYRAALAALDSQAGGSFAKLAPGRQDAVIGQLEQGKLETADLPNGGKDFFGLIRRHTLEGMLGDPAYGGNQDFAGWKLIGFPGLQLTFEPAQMALDAPDAREPRGIAEFEGKPWP